MANAASLTVAIKAEAMRLGFPLVGITLPEPPRHFGVFADWLRAGHHGAMSYLGSERSLTRRRDPKQILPEAHSIISLALSYSAPCNPPPKPGHGRVAAYAWGRDYHGIIPARLDQLVNFIEKEAGRTISQKAYTDTGPILERDFAQQAGLGWIGKNTCLIHPRFGSYFLLAEVFLELELEPDEPVMHDYCGSCQRCIEACPTGCILPDRTLDATHCISYQTIENKGSIPDELRPLMGDWIFGCDICQQVCPWNLRFGSRRGDPELSAREGVPQPDLRAEIHITPEQFNRKFRESPIQRPRRRGYLRNVAVALGNLADPATLPDLAEALLQEPEPLVRGHAAWAIGQIDTPSARDTLQMAMRNETDGQVLSEIRSALREG